MTLIDRERRAFDTRAHLEGWGRLSQGMDSRYAVQWHHPRITLTVSLRSARCYTHRVANRAQHLVLGSQLSIVSRQGDLRGRANQLAMDGIAFDR